MQYLIRSGLCLLAAVLVQALNQDPQAQQPIHEDILSSLPTSSHKSAHTQPLQTLKTSHRIAIVGGGPAGSSAAYHLSRFATSANLSHPLNITIFESNDRIGGRTTTINALNDPRYPVELGASIFVEINQILYNATRDFELPVNDRIYESSGADYDLGIWDGGDDFVFKTVATDDEAPGWKGTLFGWWDIAKLFWKYGVSPLRLRTLQRDVIGRFLRMYGDMFPFSDLTSVAGSLDLLSVTGESGSKLLEGAGISEKFAREIVQASSRVNYAQNLEDFHGLETMVCMSTEGAMSIDGGNWQIFDQMVKRSDANVVLETTVTGIETTKDGKSQLILRHNHADDPTTTSTEDFDTIILAHPYYPSTLTLTPPPNPPRETPDYVSLHVTLFTTPHRPSPLFFGLNPTAYSSVPDTILTTLPAELDPSFLGRGPNGVGPTDFWSLSTLRVLNPSTDSIDSIPSYLTSGHIPNASLSLNEPQYLYKIFSPEPLSAGYLANLFGWTNHTDHASLAGGTTTSTEEHDPLSKVSKDLLTWYHEKTWLSYPYYPPRTNFESFDVYSGVNGEEGGKKSKGKVWSTAPMEMFISTMETSALSGMNVARLIVDGLIVEKE